MCNTGQDVELQDTHTQHQDEGGNPKQHTKEIANSRCGTNTRTTALALCYSTAEYAAPVWERSCTPTEPRNESGMPSNYWMSKTNKRRELIFARGNCPS